jgi:hypothetical protein
MANATPDPIADRSKSPVDQWFEVFVYAPLGLALDARKLWPRLVDRGRSQVALARVMGRYAVRRGSKRATAYVEHSQTQLSAVLQTLGIVDDEPAPEVAQADLDDFELDVVAFEHDRPVVDEPQVDEPAPDESAPVIAASSTATVSSEDVPDVATLAIPDYDNLSASQVVPRLGGLSLVELDAVGRYEAAGRRRKTILNKVAQLRSA